MTVGDLKIGNILSLALGPDGSVQFSGWGLTAQEYEVTGYAPKGTVLRNQSGQIFILNHSNLKLTEQIEHKPTMTPIPIKSLVEYKDGAAVACVAGVLHKLAKEPARGNHAQYGPWVLQSGVLMDDEQNEYPITFADEAVIQPENMWRKRIHIECKAGQQGSTGLKIKNDKKTKIPGLWVSGSAIITYPDGKPVSANTGSSGGASAAPKGQDGATGGQSAQRAPERNVARDESTVKERVGLYFEILHEVGRGYQVKNGAPDMPILTPGDLKDIATHISMTYRGDYGAYAKPVFEVGGDSRGPTPVTEGGKVIEPKVEDWKEVVHPRPPHKKLGEYPLAKQWELWQWGLTTKADTPEGIRMKTALLLMGDALGMNATKYVMMHLKAQKLDNMDAIDDYCSQEYGVGATELSPDNWTDLTTKLRTKDGDGPLVLHIKNFSPEPDEPPFTPDDDDDIPS